MMKEELEKMKQLTDKLKSQVKSLRNDITVRRSKSKVTTSETEVQTDIPEVVTTKQSKDEDNETLRIETMGEDRKLKDDHQNKELLQQVKHS